MRFFLRALSLVVAGIDLYIILRWEGQGRPLRELWMINTRDAISAFPPAVSTAILLIFILTFIWFGDSLNEWEEELGRWCPALLPKIFGWCALLVPIVIFVFNKIK
jgi:hypothetical protein